MKTLVKGKNGFNPYTDLSTIVAVDFDGVILDFDGNFVAEAIDVLRTFTLWNIDVILWTCRPPETIQSYVDTLRSIGIRILGVNVNHPAIVDNYEVQSRKIFAHKYVDDQAVGWSKLTWKDIKNEIIAYQVKRILEGEIPLE